MIASGVLFLSLLQLGRPATAIPVPPAAQQIATAVLPLPASLRDGAGVRGYDHDLRLVTLRPSRNGLVCTGLRPDAKEFDVRCYQESFLPVVDRLREPYRQNLEPEVVRGIVDAEIKSGKLKVPAQPTAGYRMEGPLSEYDLKSNTAGPAIESWQSIHFPYRTAAEIGLPEEGTVPRAFPYVMGSGTFWAHVMIEHEAAPAK